MSTDTLHSDGKPYTFPFLRRFIVQDIEEWDMSTGREIRLVEEDDGWWSAVDETTGVASQGETREAALSNLDEAIALTERARNDDTPSPEPEAPWFAN